MAGYGSQRQRFYDDDDAFYIFMIWLESIDVKELKISESRENTAYQTNTSEKVQKQARV